MASVDCRSIRALPATVYGYTWLCIQLALWSFLIDWINKWWCYHVTNLISFDWKHISWIYFHPSFYVHAYIARCSVQHSHSHPHGESSFRRLTINTILYLFNGNNNNDMYNSDNSMRCTPCAYFLCQNLVTALFCSLSRSHCHVQWKINRMI